MGNRIGSALKRKLGPLPAWAWLAVAGVAIIFYRRFSGAQTNVSRVAATQAPDITDSTPGPGAPVTLGAGEAVYDPATGQLLQNTAPPGDATNPPVEAGVDTTAPAPEEVAAGVAPTAAPPTHVPAARRILGSVAKSAASKRLPKARPKPRNGAPGPQRAKANRPRSSAAHKPAGGARARKAAPVQRKQKPRPAPKQQSKPQRGRAPMPRPPALRQRPAAPRVMDHTAQKSVTVPRGAAPPHPAAHRGKPPPAHRKRRR